MPPWLCKIRGDYSNSYLMRPHWCVKSSYKHQAKPLLFSIAKEEVLKATYLAPEHYRTAVVCYADVSTVLSWQLLWPYSYK